MDEFEGSYGRFTTKYHFFGTLCTYNIYNIYWLISIISTQHNYTADTQLHAIQSLLQAPVDIREVSCLGVPFAQIPGEHINITFGRLGNSSQHC